MLCCVMLCYVMLCYVMLCYVMLCYVMLWYSSYDYKVAAVEVTVCLLSRIVTLSIITVTVMQALTAAWNWAGNCLVNADTIKKRHCGWTMAEIIFENVLSSKSIELFLCEMLHGVSCYDDVVIALAESCYRCILYIRHLCIDFELLWQQFRWRYKQSNIENII